MQSDLSDFNFHFLSQYGHVQFLVAGRFQDLRAAWERLACEWYARNGFFELREDRYIEGNFVRYYSVDALAKENPKELSPLGQHLYDSWLAKKEELARNRTKPPVVILPPSPTPNPIPVPKPEPVPKPPWLIKASVYITILTPLVLIITAFLPSPWSAWAKVVWAILKQLAN